MPSIENSPPVISVAIEPKADMDRQRLAESLVELSTTDRLLRVNCVRETEQTIISGVSESHIGDILHRLRLGFKVDIKVGKPQVAYRETICKRVDQEGKFVWQTGGRGQYGHVRITLEPLAPCGGFEFVDRTEGAWVPKEYIPAVEEGIREAFEGGVLAGYPLIDVKATLFDGSYHDVDSSEIAFKIAGSIAAKEGALKAKPIILEPIMAVEAVVPEEFMAVVVDDLTRRRSEIKGTDSRGGVHVINAHVPLAQMFGYSTELRPKTQGRATYKMEFSEYTEVSVLPDPDVVLCKNDDSSPTARKVVLE
jgi:elongation factor G